jgi:2-polyprenyl-3-methyl-5-hydroxy-6-metoxy-1,4-benzoquinol methylase
METDKRKAHWENVYQTKDTTKVNWYQAVPETSLRLIENLNLSASAKIIEVGCGNSNLTEILAEKGYSEITLVDISEVALEMAKVKLGEKAKQITWLAADVANFEPPAKYNVWHDRAVFHFLNERTDIQKYVSTAYNHILHGGHLIISTFSNNGPDECSGLHVQQYSEKELTEIFGMQFKRIECFAENHKTPSGGSQNFLFCVFQRI